MTTIITFIIVFGILVIVHEFGHFYFAKKAGVRVREFAIGMGPKLFQTRRNGTTYTIRVLPVGGYVRMAGRAEAEEETIRPGMTIVVVQQDGVVTRLNLSDQTELVGGRALTVNRVDLVDDMFVEGYWADDDQTLVKLPVDHEASVIEADGTEVLVAPRDTHFESAKLWQRALINFAGPMNNFILTVVLFMGLAFAMPGVTTTTLQDVAQNSPAATAGLKKGDTIEKINGVKMSSWQKMQTTIQALPKEKTTVTYERNGQSKTTKLTPKAVKNGGMLVGQIGVTPTTTKAFVPRVQYAFRATGQAMTQIFRAIQNLIQGFSLNKLGGPVAIYKNTEQVSSYGFLAIVSFTALLSVNLGMMNLLPIPGLDGGKLLLNAVEAVVRRPLPERVETAVTLAGVAFLFVLMIAVTGNDIIRYFFK
ncbi:RIP metalloprotease RseP [Weissella cibaria]|uniref:RIP metalloprotease RseP n=1 Tax=Weissella cibaria TaxID=137591 RepID=UPI000D0ACCA5|nr:RIP metalloprotease RseP [Weissella cibaria]AVO66502.1 RIP metalloprotease RseP [Weissella cibaria]MBU7544526.1 RIP metalloprotease RseP [Weissella cibaria]MCT0956819.1 RIP metalloprotease RseP [Weissella cibaria]MCV3318141.1 RIP metalloprotease RseP [Weissella cibaria]HJF38738.1 RIP metalloprotease RseP [Weissella cibaria]